MLPFFNEEQIFARRKEARRFKLKSRNDLYKPACLWCPLPA
jgi:hypothetical protein